MITRDKWHLNWFISSIQLNEEKKWSKFISVKLDYSISKINLLFNLEIRTVVSRIKIGNTSKRRYIGHVLRRFGQNVEATWNVRFTFTRATNHSKKMLVFPTRETLKTQMLNYKKENSSNLDRKFLTENILWLMSRKKAWNLKINSHLDRIQCFDAQTRYQILREDLIF